MKLPCPKSMLAALLLAGALTGCRSLGYNGRSAQNALTPGVDEKVYTRTYPSGKGAGGQDVPLVEETPAIETTTDPAYPNYSSPATSGNTSSNK